MFQKRFFHFLLTFMYYLDLFKSPLTLMFNKKRFISTKFGFLCSMAIFSILFVMVMDSDLFQKALPQILTSNLPTTHRPLIKFDNKILAIGVQDDTYFKGYVDPTIYSVKVSNMFYISDPSGGYTRTTVEKNVHICSEDDFEDNTFENLGLANNFCFDEGDNNLDLEGFFDESMVTFVYIELFLCNNLTQNNSCQGFDEMEEQLNGKTFNIYFQDAIINSKNYQNPIQKTIVNKY